MDIKATLATTVSADRLDECLNDLSRYPHWLDIVPRATVASPIDGDEGPAWFVTLRAKMGPLARAKRLRMVRTSYEPGESVRFERREDDGRDHAAWVLSGALADNGNGTTLTMTLHYGGSLWLPMLDKLLAAEIERSKPRLVRLAEA